MRKHLGFPKTGNIDPGLQTLIDTFACEHKSQCIVWSFDPETGLFAGKQNDDYGISRVSGTIMGPDIQYKQIYVRVRGITVRNIITGETDPGLNVHAKATGTVERTEAGISMDGIYACDSPWGILTGTWQMRYSLENKILEPLNL